MLISFQDLCEMFVESPEVQDTGEAVGVCSGLKALEFIAPGVIQASPDAHCRQRGDREQSSENEDSGCAGHDHTFASLGREQTGLRIVPMQGGGLFDGCDR